MEIDSDLSKNLGDDSDENDEEEVNQTPPSPIHIDLLVDESMQSVDDSYETNKKNSASLVDACDENRNKEVYKTVPSRKDLEDNESQLYNLEQECNVVQSSANNCMKNCQNCSRMEKKIDDLTSLTKTVVKEIVNIKLCLKEREPRKITKIKICTTKENFLEFESNLKSDETLQEKVVSCPSKNI